MPAYAFYWPCLARGLAVDVSECVVLAATSCCWDLFVSRQAVERELPEASCITRGKGLRRTCDPNLGRIAKLTAECGAPQAAVSLSLQLVMPPFLFRRHDPSRGEADGLIALALATHGVPELRFPAELRLRSLQASGRRL